MKSESITDHDLPVRYINIFGEACVVPKDTVCMVKFLFDVSRGLDYSCGILEVKISVKMQHSHFLGGEMTVCRDLFQASSQTTPQIKKIFPVATLRCSGNSTDFSNRVTGGRKWDTVLAWLELHKIRDLVLQMFLDGNVISGPLKPLVPKTSVLFFSEKF